MIACLNALETQLAALPKDLARVQATTGDGLMRPTAVEEGVEEVIQVVYNLCTTVFLHLVQTPPFMF